MTFTALPVNITFQGAAAKLSYTLFFCFLFLFFSCVVCQVLVRVFFFYFLMSTSKSNYSPQAQYILANIYFAFNLANNC